MEGAVNDAFAHVDILFTLIDATFMGTGDRTLSQEEADRLMFASTTALVAARRARDLFYEKPTA